MVLTEYIVSTNEGRLTFKKFDNLVEVRIDKDGDRADCNIAISMEDFNKLADAMWKGV